MSLPEVEAIGLASSSTEPATKPSTEEPGTPVEPPSRMSRGIHPLWVLGLLVAVGCLLWALSNEAGRAALLENQVALVSAELDQARADLAGYEMQMDGVRTAVADLSTRMSSLQALVDQPPGAQAEH